MSEPVESIIRPMGVPYRTLTWGSGDETVLFLHGLSGVAEVWIPTIDHLEPSRRYVAMDLTGHGRSWAPSTGYAAHQMATGPVTVIEDLGRVHLVGHSLGARLAMLIAAQFPQMLRSAAIVDIGPEASKANITATVRGIESRPERFSSRDEALAFAFRSRTPTPLDERIFLARLDGHDDGSFTWRASKAALIEAVTKQRSRSYWKEWGRITLPTMYVHGGASNEVSTAIADRMRAENPSVRFERLAGVGHNIPLIAPGQLAGLLESHWSTLSATVA
jgi:2-(acetamidomethylene)succinate hydrolase